MEKMELPSFNNGNDKEILVSEIETSLKKLKNELAEVNLFLELGITKIPKNELLKRKEELSKLIETHEKLKEEANGLKEAAA